VTYLIVMMMTFPSSLALILKSNAPLNVSTISDIGELFIDFSIEDFNKKLMNTFFSYKDVVFGNSLGLVSPVFRHCQENSVGSGCIDIEEILAEKVTLKIKNIEKYEIHEDFKLLKCQLDKLTRKRITLNVYYTPASSFGFPKHIDNHHVLIFQLHGKKIWITSHGAYISSKNKKLFIPRGIAHQTRSSGDSLHLTVGLYDD